MPVNLFSLIRVLCWLLLCFPLVRLYPAWVLLSVRTLVTPALHQQEAVQAWHGHAVLLLGGLQCGKYLRLHNFPNFLYQSLFQSLLQVVYGVKLVLTGDDLQHNEHALIVLNHPTRSGIVLTCVLSCLFKKLQRLRP